MRGGGALNADELGVSPKSSSAKSLPNAAESNSAHQILLADASLNGTLLADNEVPNFNPPADAPRPGERDGERSEKADAPRPSSADGIRTYQLDAVNINSVGDEISESGIDEGILNKGVANGPLDNKRVIDVPYQVNTITRELLDNQNIQSFDEAVKYFPSAQLEYRGGAEQGRPQTRGFRGSVIGNSFWDGFYNSATTAIPMAMFESLQVQNGLSGSLYGGQEPVGTFSYTRKRPKKDYNAVWFDFISRGNLGVGLDTSDKFQYVGYRAVLFTTNGEREPANAETQRQLASFALDFYPTETLVFETNFSHYRHIMTGYYNGLSIPSTKGVATRTVPGVLAATTSGTERFMETTTASAKFKFAPHEAWYFEGGYQYQRAIRNRGNTSRFDVPSAFVKAQFEAQTGVISHNISLSANGYQWLSGASKSLNEDMKNVGLLYDIGITRYFDLLFSGAYSWFKGSDYKQGGISWAGSAMVKIIPDKFNIYFTYADSLKAGTAYTYDTDAGYTNAHPLFDQTVTFKPYRSVMYELGAKARIAQLDFSLALFQITRPTYYVANNEQGFAIFGEQGEQRNRGIEISTGGKLAEPLSVYGGITILDAKMNKSAFAESVGKRKVGEPLVQTNVLFDFAVPNTNKLAFTTNFHYTSDRFVDELNTQSVKGYFTMDLGVRYATRKWLGKETTVRLNINNLWNERYWVGMFPGGSSEDTINGALPNSASTNLFRGNSRTFILSGQVKF